MTSSLLAIVIVAASPIAPPARAHEATPPVKHGHYDPRNFDGVWHLADGGKFGPTAVKDGVKYVVYPFTPEYQAIYDKRLADAAAGNPYQTAGTTCLPSGAIRLLTGGGPPLEIFHTPDKIAILKENGGWARIYLHRQHLPADELYPMFYGDSIGHWDGNTLVVDTISLGGANNIDGAAPHSNAAHLVQRISRPTFDTLRVEATLDDSKALQHPVTAVANLNLEKDEDFTESFCTNDRNVRDSNGNQTVKLPPMKWRPMTGYWRAVTLGLAVCGLPWAATAHHSFAMFDANQTEKAHGTVKEFQWGNPHTWLELVVQNEDGTERPLSLELNGLSGLKRNGWKPGTVKPSDKVTVTYHPMRDGTPAGQLVDIVTEDGQTLKGQ